MNSKEINDELNACVANEKTITPNKSVYEIRTTACKSFFHKLLIQYGKERCPDKNQAFQKCIKTEKDSSTCESLLKDLTKCGLIRFENDKEPSYSAASSMFIPKIEKECGESIKQRYQCATQKGDNNCGQAMMETTVCFTQSLCPFFLDQVIKCRGNSMTLFTDDTKPKFLNCINNIRGLKPCLATSRLDYKETLSRQKVSKV